MGKFSALNDDEQRLLILLDSRCEAEASAKSLTLSGIQTVICDDMDNLCRELQAGVGALLVGKEIFADASLSRLSSILLKQPAWSHVPIVVLLGGGDLLISSDPSFRKLEPLGNVTLLENPVRLSTLISTVRASIAYRRRQYQQRELLEQLEQSRHEAVEANRAKSDFLANMSHEIRTPLGAVLGFAELLMDEGVSERERKIYMTTIRRNGQLLSALIDDILDLSKVESGRIELESMEFSFVELLSEVVSVLEPQAARKGLSLTVERSPEVPQDLRGDPIRVKQVLMNIVGNAIKFTAQGAVLVRVEGGETAGALRLSIRVEDSGIGISAAHARRLFQPFTQADSSTTRRFGGSGLGLVLARQLARAMGGDVSLERSLPGGGSCFLIELMVERVNQRVIPFAAGREHSPSLCGPLGGRHLLVVDDSPDNQMLIGRVLRLMGAGVDTAEDGVQAVQMAQANCYDAILMDLQMPRMGGLQATRILRDHGYTRPIVAVTAHALKEDRAQCLNAGCSDYLTKPLQRTQLLRVLETIWSARPRPSLARLDPEAACPRRLL